MPNLDQNGPCGEGAQTGRRMRKCSGFRRRFTGCKRSFLS